MECGRVVSSSDDCEPTAGGVFTAAAVGAGLGAAVGTLVGALRPTEEWARLDLPVSAGAAPTQPGRGRAWTALLRLRF